MLRYMGTDGDTETTCIGIIRIPDVHIILIISGLFTRISLYRTCLFLVLYELGYFSLSILASVFLGDLISGGKGENLMHLFILCVFWVISLWDLGFGRGGFP